MRADHPRCPFCHGGELVRSRRRGLEWLISWLSFYPFRCADCARRTLKFVPRRSGRASRSWLGAQR